MKAFTYHYGSSRSLKDDDTAIGNKLVQVPFFLDQKQNTDPRASRKAIADNAFDIGVFKRICYRLAGLEGLSGIGQMKPHSLEAKLLDEITAGFIRGGRSRC